MNTVLAQIRHYNFFGLEFDFNNVAFTIGSFEVYWYGIIIAVGFLIALIYGYKNADRYQIDKDRMLDVIIVGLVGAIICARLYYIIGDGVPLSYYGSFKEKLNYIFGIHNGGIGIYGGVFGAFLFGGLTAKLRKINVFDMFDLAATGFLIGQAVGRWGNFVNQEVYGLATGSDWFGIGGDRIGTELVHPLFLYESLWCVLCFVILHNVSKKRVFKGQVFLGYLILYPFGRYWFEGMRDTEFILKFGEMSQAQLVCIISVILATVLYIIFYKRSKTADKDGDYRDVFGEMCDDEDVLAAAYELLCCDDDSSDSEVEAAYTAMCDKYAAMLPEADGQTDDAVLSKSEKKKRAKAAKEQAEREQSILESEAPKADEEGMIEISEEELRVRVKAKLAELEKAYKYIKGYRELAAMERASFDESTAEENTDETD